MCKCTGADHIFDKYQIMCGSGQVDFMVKKVHKHCIALNYFLHSCLNAYLYSSIEYIAVQCFSPSQEVGNV